MTAPIITGITIGQAIQAITPIKISAKGISINAVIVAEVIKSRTVSKDLKLDENDPTELGRCSNRVPNTCSIMRPESLISTR